MNGELKTLDQLSGSPADKKYITLDVGSQISGYTKDYLERLCRLGKVESGQWTRGSGQLVVELNSLLRETHTLLISNEGLLFVDKKEVVLPDTGSSAAGAVPPASSLPLPPTPPSVPLPTPTLVKMPPSAPPPPAKIFQSTPLPAQILPKQNFGLPVRSQTQAGGQALPSPPATPAPQMLYTDEWDKLLFSGVSDIPEEIKTLAERPTEKPKEIIAPIPPPLYETPSPYRPIQTSVDPAPHRDPAPLFPPLVVKTPASANTPPTRQISPPLPSQPPGGGSGGQIPPPAPSWVSVPGVPAFKVPTPSVAPTPASSPGQTLRATPTPPFPSPQPSAAYLPASSPPPQNFVGKAVPPLPPLPRFVPPVSPQPPTQIPRAVSAPTSAAQLKLGEEHHLAVPDLHTIIKRVTGNKFERNNPS